jgi:acyl carrier protein
VKEKIKIILFDILKEMGEELEIETFKNINEQTAIYDKLDSMALLDFILEVEDALQKTFGRYIQIADETTMDRKSTPLKSLNSTIEMILTKVQNG